MDNQPSEIRGPISATPNQTPSSDTPGEYVDPHVLSPPTGAPHCDVDSSSLDSSIPPCNQGNNFFEEKYFSLLRSFESIFNLLQHSEEMRTNQEELCQILLSSRTVAGLIRGVSSALKRHLEVKVVRILFREDHPISSYLAWDPPEHSGLIPPGLLETEPMEFESPFVIDYPSGRLSRTLFKSEYQMVASATIASLHAHGRHIGFLCLASDDPYRFAGGMNTDPVAGLAEMVSLGIQNAWDHENTARASVTSDVAGLYSESYFQEFLTHEFLRCWRYGKSFALVALSWSPCNGDRDESLKVLPHLLKSHVRASEIVSMGDNCTVWFLLPESNERDAGNLVQRLTAALKDLSQGEIVVHAGITEFSRYSTAPSDLIHECRNALREAQQCDQDRVMMRSIGPPASTLSR